MKPRLIEATAHTLRHVKPASSGTTVLDTTLAATRLPVSVVPDNADFVEGSYTGRLGDGGQYKVTFPNGAGSDGLLWRDRFNADRQLEFLEIWEENEVVFVGTIDDVKVDLRSVTVSGIDAYPLLKKAYEQDRTWLAGPRDVVEHYSQVKVAALADDFDTMSSSWIAAANASRAIDGEGNLVVTCDNASGDFTVYRDISASAGDDFDLTAVLVGFDDIVAILGIADNSGSYPYADEVRIQVGSRDVGALIEISVAQGGVYVNKSIPSEGISFPITVQIVKRGRWVGGFVNGKLIAYLPWDGDQTLDRVYLQNTGTSSTATWASVVMSRLTPFLMRGSDKGEYVLPGSQPTGGLRGRYYNYGDLQGLGAPAAPSRAFAPDRLSYGERIDEVVDTGTISVPLQPGSSDSYYAVRWFGSVYLRGDLGDYTFQLLHRDGVRLWVGKTGWGDQIIDDWTSGAARTSSATWDAGDHGDAAGWYPIVVEWYRHTTAYGVVLTFTPPATGYTDPGGTSIVGSSKITVPATSLSPLGCYDNRIQGQSHFEIVRQVAQDFGYQMRLEPKQLESGQFPGALAPRARQGQDYDVLLELDSDDSTQPLIDPAVDNDASEQVLRLYGTGAGVADGKGAQVTGQVADVGNLDSALFLLEGWVDAGGVSFSNALLAARLEAELALRASVWQELSGTPRGQSQLADGWPLTGTLSRMKWRPGDGVRVRIREVGLEDTDPRQMSQVTRTFRAFGLTGTEVDFRDRPRSAAHEVRRLLRAGTETRRTYGGRLVPANTGLSNTAGGSTGAGTFGDYVMLALNAADRVVSAEVRITSNSASQNVDLEVNGTLVGSTLGGPWTKVPTWVDITRYAKPAGSTDPRIYVRPKNVGGASTIIQIELSIKTQE